MPIKTTPTVFATPALFRRWLKAHHAREQELVLRLFKVHALHRGIGYKQALDEALCMGWIDGIRRGYDGDSFTVRFTPRRPRSIWSAVNIRRVNELIVEGRMQPNGLAEFAKRDEKRSRIYSFENRDVGLSSEYEKAFKRDTVAWSHFMTMAPWYRRTAIFLVMTAKKEETRLRRLRELITCSRAKLSIEQLRRTK